MRVLTYLLILTILIFSFNTFLPGVFYGKLIMKLNKPKLKERLRKVIMWGFGIIFFSFFFVINIMEYRNMNPYADKYYYIYQISFSLYWVIYALLIIIRVFKAIEIREKGILFDEGYFYKFKSINYYTLKSPNVITLNYKGFLKSDKDYELKFRDEEEAMRFDHALERYVKRI